jgi:ribosomal protein S6
MSLVVPPDVEQPQIQDATQKYQDMITAATPTLSDAKFWELKEFLTESWDIFAMDSDD